MKENAVDGLIYGGMTATFAAHPDDLHGWILVDLESKYVIRAVRVFARTDANTSPQSTVSTIACHVN